MKVNGIEMLDYRKVLEDQIKELQSTQEAINPKNTSYIGEKIQLAEEIRKITETIVSIL